MLNRSRSRSFIILAVALSLALGPAGCASEKPREKWWQFWRPKKVAMAGADGVATDTVILPAPELADGIDPITGLPIKPEGGAIPDMGLPEPTTIRDPATLSQELVVVHFDYDSANLTSSAMETLDRNYEWIKAHPGVQILIEGHCDERGTVEYNLNLGQRRAAAVKVYLVQKGAVDSALHTISYGEERPIDSGSGEASWAQNRRAQFLVY